MGALHNEETKIAHATSTRTNLLAEGDPILKVIDSDSHILLEVDPITLTALGAGDLEDWQFAIDSVPIVETAIDTGTAYKVQLCNALGNMVTEVSAVGAVSPLAIETGKNIQINSVIYSAV